MKRLIEKFHELFSLEIELTKYHWKRWLKNFIEKMYSYCEKSLDLFGDKNIIENINSILNKGTEGDEQIKIYEQGGFDKLKLYLMNNVDYLKKE